MPYNALVFYSDLSIFFEQYAMNDKARELNPKFPGIIDNSLWELGRTQGKDKRANFDGSSVCEECPKIL